MCGGGGGGGECGGGFLITFTFNLLGGQET